MASGLTPQLAVRPEKGLFEAEDYFFTSLLIDKINYISSPKINIPPHIRPCDLYTVLV